MNLQKTIKNMKKIIKLTESDLERIIKRVLKEESTTSEIQERIWGDIEKTRDTFTYQTQEMRNNISIYKYISDKYKNCKLQIWSNGSYFYQGCNNNVKGTWKKKYNQSSGWEKVKNFYSTDKSPNFQFKFVGNYYPSWDKGIVEIISCNLKQSSTKYTGSNCKLNLMSSGHAVTKGCNGLGVVEGTWVLDNKESGGFKLVGFDTRDSSVKGDVTKKASDYVTDTDTDLKVALVDNNKIMGKGSKGNLVKKIQSYLLNNGYEKFDKISNETQNCKLNINYCDGIYGSGTSAAVKQFQTDKGLKSKDGVVGKETIKAMGLL